LLAWTDVERSASRMVRSLHAWWLGARGPLGLPNRRDFDPAAFKFMMPHLIIAELERDPFRIRYRLVGTRVAAFTGFNFTGRYLDELISLGSTDRWQQHYVRAHDERTPVFGSETEPTTSGGSFTFEFGIFPLTLAGERVDQFLSVEDYFGTEITSAQVRPRTGSE
jgi:hypothetical protein